MSTNYLSPATVAMTQNASTPKGAKGGSTWFEAMAEAWGQALDNQANSIQQRSDAISNGADTPSEITELTAESLKMGFLSNSAHSSISAVGQALETMARKQ